MISIETVVAAFLFLLGCAAIFGIMFAILWYVEKTFPGETTSMICRFARIFLFIAAGLILIGLVLSLMGYPIIDYNRRR